MLPGEQSDPLGASQLQPLLPMSVDKATAGGASSSSAASSPPLSASDYRNLLHLSTSRIACFRFERPIPVSLPRERLIALVWSTKSSCVEASQAFALAHGFNGYEQLQGRSFSEFFPGNPTNRALIEHWSDNNFFVANYEVRVALPQGEEEFLSTSLYTIFESAAIRHIWVVTRDVSEFRRAVEALRDSESHYRNLVERPGLLLVRTGADGKHLYLTPAVADLLGYTLEDFNRIPSLFTRLLHPEDVAKHDVIYQARREKWTKPVEAEYRIHCRDGTYHWFLERQTPKLNKNGDIEYFDSVALDIQEHKQLESELLHAQKMETIGKLAGGIAHDFNNHLTAILGQISLSLNEIDPDHPCYGRLSAAEQAALRCAEMTAQLLAFGHKSDYLLKPLAVRQLLEDTNRLIRHIFPATIELKLTINPDAQAVIGNFVQLQQVLMNLAINSRDAMPRGGRLTIALDRLEITKRAGEKRFPNAAPGDYVLFVVTDTGEGIPASYLSRVFEPFFTTKRSGDGTGLGLSMVYSIVKSHGGQITIDSEEGVGTTVSFIIPSGEQPKAEEARAPSKALLAGHETVLVADDDEMVLTMASSALSAQGYRVLQASNGAEAIDLFRQHQNEVALVLVDQTMPRVAGREVAAEILRMNDRVSVVLTSGYGQPELDSNMLGLERLAFLGKPYPLTRLLTLIRQLLDARRSSGEVESSMH